MLLASFERDADTLHGALQRAHYLEASGRWTVLALSQVYERFPELSSLDSYEQLLDAETDERVGLGLQRLVLEQFVGGYVARGDQRLANAQRTVLVEWAGEAIPWRLARQLVSLQEERGPRHELDEAIRASSDGIPRLRLERIQASRRQILETGQYDLPTDDLGFWAFTRSVDVEGVSKLAEWVLEETSELYLDALRDQLAHHHLDEGDTWEVDLEWIFRGQEYDRIFPTERLMPTVTRALWDLGIRLEDQAHVRLDLDDLPGRVERSFCAPIGVPDEVVAVLAPRGGIADYVAMLHALGESERYAHADQTQSIVYRRFGDRAVTEAYGLLLAGLLERPEWLANRLESEATRDAIRLRAFERLYRLRRAAALHLYEVELRKAEEPDALETEYVDRLAEVLYVRPFTQNFLDVSDDPFASAQHLRASLLGCQLRQFLEQEVDEEWYRSIRSGRFLIDRWREGQRYTAEEVVRFLGFEGLDPRPLVAELRQGLVG
jgi:hypothetical protein